MDCLKARRKLSALADGELSGDEGAEAATHAGSCPDCDRFRRSIEATRAHFSSLLIPPAPADLAERVRRRLLAPAARLLATRPICRRVAVAASILLLLTGAAILFSPRRPPAPTVSISADGAIEELLSAIVRDNTPALREEVNR